MTIVETPLIVMPQVWTVVFDPRASRRWMHWLIPGRYKHVRAYAYVPGLHVWLFYDVNFDGTDLVVAADGRAAQAMIAAWIAGANLVRVKRRGSLPGGMFRHVGFLCVPAIRHLLGIPGSALRPDGLWRDCLRHGGEPFEGVDESDDRQHPAADGGRATA